MIDFHSRIPLRKAFMYYKRAIEQAIQEAGKSLPCVALYGPRQVGKSTTLRHLFSTMRYVTLDDASQLALAQDNPRLFLESHGWPLIIDEIHKAPALLPEIKIAIDRQRLAWLEEGGTRTLMFIISGSNQFNLREQVSESLAGRVAEIHMLPFTQHEARKTIGEPFTAEIALLQAKESERAFFPLSRSDVFQNIFRGGMPDVVTEVAQRDIYFKSYLSTYIEKDVRSLISASHESTFIRFMEYVALRTGQQLNYDEISSSVGINNATCRRWMSILESSGIIVLLQPYMPNASTRIIKSPKLYFTDTGLCSYLCGWPNAGMLEKGVMAGAFFETYVVIEIWKSFLNANIDPKHFLYYYRDKDNKEVDVLFVQQGAICPIEIKKGVNPIKPNKNFKVLSKYKMPLRTGMVIDCADTIRAINEGVYAIPVGAVGA